MTRLSFSPLLLVAFVLLACVSCASAQSAYPGTIYNAVSAYAPPSTIPANGYLTGVVEYASNCSNGVNLHFEITDPSKNYNLAGGQTRMLASPSYGSAMFTLSPFQNLNTTDGYLLSVFSACTGGNPLQDYLVETAVAYYGITVAPQPTSDTLVLFNPPTTIPSSGVTTIYAQWSSSFVGYVSLHLDLTDVSAGYQGDGNSYLNVSSPGSGIVIFTVNITNPSINTTHNIIFDYYLTYGNYTAAAGLGQDYLHQAASGSYAVTLVPYTSLRNSLTITNPPTTIPQSGTFTLSLQWQTVVRGVVNVHVDISDLALNFKYDGGQTTQVVGPGSGTITFVMSYNGVGGSIPTNDTYQLHAYLTPENSTQVFGSGVDYQHSISDQYYPVTVTKPPAVQPGAYPGTIYNAVSAYAPPSTIPANGYLTGVVEYASNCSNGVNLHFEITDPSKNYNLAGGQTRMLASPSYGSAMFTLSPFQNLNTTDGYLLSVFSACTGGNPLQDYLVETAVAYYGITVAPQPTSDTLVLFNPPTTIPSSGVTTIYAQWSSSFVGYVSLHLDLTDVSAGYQGDGNSYLNVSSPGSGIVIFTVNITNPSINTTHNIIFDYYLTYGNYTAAAGLGQDYLHQAASGSYAVTLVPYTSLRNSLTITNPPTTIPQSGTFTLSLQWQTVVRGVVNVHVDISDLALNFKYDGGQTTQVVGPGSGTITFVMSYNGVGGSIPTNDTYQLHAYLTPENSTQVFGSGVDYQHSISDQYYPVLVAGPAVSAQLCFLFYALPGNVDYPWSSSLSMSVLYQSTPVSTSLGQAVNIVSGTGTRQFTNRFGISTTSLFTIAPAGTASSDNLLYLNSPFPVDSAGLTLSFSSPLQLPGQGPTQLTSQYRIYNQSGVVLEGGASRVDGFGSAFLGSVPSFANISIGASNINSLAANYAGCTAPISCHHTTHHMTLP